MNETIYDAVVVGGGPSGATAATELRYGARPDLISPRLEHLVTLDDAGFRERFAGSPIKRIGRDRFVRRFTTATNPPAGEQDEEGESDED